MLGDDIAWALPHLRAQAESLMTDACRITREAEGRGELDPATGQYPARALDAIYEGKCRIQVRSATADARSGDAGGQSVVTQYTEIQLPVEASTDVAVNDIVEVTACRFDESLVGRVLTVRGRHAKSHATSRRLSLVEVTG